MLAFGSVRMCLWRGEFSHSHWVFVKQTNKQNLFVNAASIEIAKTTGSHLYFWCPPVLDHNPARARN